MTFLRSRSQHLVSINVIISPHQHGFLRRLSCKIQLVTVIHDWANFLTHHGQIDVIFLDFAKAFESVPHESLLLKAYHYGFCRKLHAWLRSFLAGRRQRVVVNGISSDWSPVVSGVPHGTVFGPTFFLLFTNDLPDSISSNIKLFADDCVLYRSVNSVRDHHDLQNDLLCLARWAATRQMNFTPQKCMKMSITIKKSPSVFQYSLCNVRLMGSPTRNILGWSSLAQ